MPSRAVVFDLWDTLVLWPVEDTHLLRERSAARYGVSLEALDELWYEPGAYARRESGPLRPELHAIAAAFQSKVDVEELFAWRVELMRRVLVPADGTIDALSELRRRGCRLGLVSNCTEDVAVVWPETPLAPLFDIAVFSSLAGCMKPSPRIYELVTDGLGVAADDCLFVGDGANDELGGAQRVGMTPVLIHRSGEEPRWEGLRDWEGLRVTSVPGVLELLG